MKFIRSS